jgi:muconolactone D-isomerase
LASVAAHVAMMAPPHARSQNFEVTSTGGAGCRTVRPDDPQGGAVLFFVRFEISQPETLANADLVETWKREAAAALGAKDAGAVTHLWKVAGQRVVLAVVDLPSAEDLDRALASLPIIREMGAGVRTEALPIYAYETFASDLNAGIHGS